jgi:hypothetical protein
MIFTISTLESNTEGGVIVAHWRVSKASGNLTASAYGTVSLTPVPDSQSYIPYSELTEQDVVAWVEAELDLAAIEAGLDADLAEQASPSIAVGVPW